MNMIEEVSLPNGSIVEIYQDLDPESPREWENLGTFWTYHRRYSSPDPVEGDRPPADAIVLPVYIYEHSGVVYNTTGFHCPWDSGQVGWIFVTRAKVCEEFGVKRISEALRQRVKKILRGEVETYSQWAGGEVYGYIVPETGDSCWGFYDRDHLLEEAGC